MDPKYSRWLSGDPALGEYISIAGEDNSKLPAGGVFNLMSFSLFNYANNNPIKYNDPTGRNPVYDIEGELIGVTENSGLQGEAFIMNKEDYDAKMTFEDAKNIHHVGIITKISDGNIYYTAHTNDRKDRLLENDKKSNDKSIVIIHIMDEAF